MNALICEAIQTRRRLELDYDGLHRIVEPYCHGVSSTGAEVLRAIQVGGASRSGLSSFGKLWTVDKMRLVRLGEHFTPDDPNYNPRDTAMTTIHCHI